MKIGLRKVILQPGRTAAAPFKWFVLGVAGKSSWQWLELLIIPVFLAIGAYSLENQADGRQAKIADARAKQETLDNYLEKMQGLLLDRNLRSAKEESEVRSVARAITTTAIKELDSDRNALLISFLKESDLIRRTVDSEDKTLALLLGLDLSDANLSRANLRDANLYDANLFYADLSYVDLISANLSDANLRGANMISANLRNANLSDADLRGANMISANLRNANLSGANLSDADLRGATVIGTKFGQGFDLSDEVKQDLIKRGAIFDAKSKEQESSTQP